MPKPDDYGLTPEQLRDVRREAERALRAADAFGCFPTPVERVMEMAKVVLGPDALDEGFVRKMRRKAGDLLKKALGKVLGVFDATARLIYIDRTVLVVKQTFLKLHETAHAFMPWQRDIYQVVEECEKTIAPEMSEQFDREANVFASEVLFQLDTFENEAADHSFGILVPVRLHKKYGASIYSAIRRYVSTSLRPCIVLVLNPPELLDGHGFVATLRRTVHSTLFLDRFGHIDWPEQYRPEDIIGKMIPLDGKRMSGRRTIRIRDDNGQYHECLAEAFTQKWQVFVLIWPVDALTATRVIVPG
jgi:hypothetical protein